MVCFQKTQTKTNSIKAKKKSHLEINYSNHLNLEIKQWDSERLYDLAKATHLLSCEFRIQFQFSWLQIHSFFFYYIRLPFKYHWQFFLKKMVPKSNGAFRIHWIKMTINNVCFSGALYTCSGVGFPRSWLKPWRGSLALLVLLLHLRILWSLLVPISYQKSACAVRIWVQPD